MDMAVSNRWTGLLQAALRSEFSDIVVDLCNPVPAADFPPECLVLTDDDLMNSPVPSVKSSEPDFDLYD